MSVIKILLRYRFLLLLLVIWLVILKLVDPTGNFGVNDDWAYVHNTKALVEQGEFYFSDWPAMTLISQTMWGVFFSKIFGFSLFNLRIATMVLAILSSLVFFKLLKQESEKEFLSFLITLALIGSPFFMGLSFTYMTEIYYLFFAGFSFLFFARIFRRERFLDWLLACVFVILAVMVRQIGLIFPIGFCLVYLAAKPINVRNVFLSFLPLILAYLSLIIYKYLRSTIDPTMGAFSEMGDLFRNIQKYPISHYINRIGVVLHHIGFGLIPVSFLLLSRLNRTLTMWKWIQMGLILIPVLLCMLNVWEFFPLGNMLQDFEMGPRLLKDTELFGKNTAAPLNEIIWNCVRCLNIVSITLFINALFSHNQIDKALESRFKNLLYSIRTSPFFWMMLLVFLAELVYLILNPNFFDRYSLPIIFTGLILVGIMHRKVSVSQRNLVIGSVSIFLLVSSFLLKDYMNWHKARLRATDYLQYEMQIPLTKIDGGFEFNSYYQIYGWNPHPLKTTDKSWWFVKEDDYVITCGDLEGYEKFMGFPTYPTISTSSDSVFILKKLNVAVDSILE